MRVASTENDWSRYSYSASSIEKRTGLTREEIRELREYGQEEASDSPFKREEGVRGIRNEDIKPKSKPGINLKKGAEQSVRRSSLIESPFSVEANEEGVQKVSINLPGGFGASYGNDGIGVSGFGFGVESGEDKSSVELPGGIKITFVNKGCFVITVQHIFNQYAFSNIERKPGCDDDSGSGGNDEPKPPHCFSLTKKPSRANPAGSPRNLMPECANDGKIHTFYRYNNSMILIEGRDPTGYYKDTDQYFLSTVTKTSCISAWSVQNVEDINGITKSEITDAIQPIDFTGTYQEFQAFAESQNIPSTNVEFTTNSSGGSYYYRHDVWWTVIICEPGYDCNPTGDEGCEGSNSRSGNENNNRSNPSKFPKPSGGLKSKNKSTEDGEMNCCSRLEKKLGLDAFPGELPVSILQKEDGEVVKIESLSQLLLWLIDSLDERLGKFPVTVKIEDTNPLKEGNQSQEIDFPNIAEFMAETYALGFQNSMSNAIQLNIQTNLLIENGLLKQSLTRVENILSEIIPYYGWEVKESSKKIDVPYTAEKSNYDEFLKPGKLDVKIIDRVDSKDNLELNIILDKLMEAATIIKQTNFRKINPNSDIASQIANYARLGLDVYNTVKGSKDDDKNWEDFKEKIASDKFYSSDEKPLINEVGDDS